MATLLHGSQYTLYARPFRSLSVSILLLVTCLEQLALSQEENFELTFALPSDVASGDVKIIEADVVFGYIKLHGLSNIPGLIPDIGVSVQATLAEVCLSPFELTGSLVQDIQTFNQVPFSVELTFWMLPHPTAMRPEGCQAKFGPMLDDPSEFMQLLTWRVANYESTKDVNTYAWEAQLFEPWIYSYRVQYPTRHPDPPIPVSPLATTTVAPGSVPDAEEGRTLPPVEAECVPNCPTQKPGWTSSYHRRRSMASLLPKCSSASSGCICAAVGKCKWSPTNTGGMTCNASTVADAVSCESCALQTRCPVDPARLCELEASPCSCVASSGDCKWDVQTNVCKERLDGETPCSACTRQPHCDQISVVSIFPDRLDRSDIRSVIPEISGLQREIRVKFDRDIVRTSLPGAVVFQCQLLDQTVVVPKEALSIKDDTLIINVHSVRNQRMIKCDLVIYEGAIADKYGIQFLGMMRGDEQNGFLFWLGDTLGPQIDSYEPQNSDTGIPLDASVTMMFDESIKVAESFEVSLLALGQGSGDDTDKVVLTIKAEDGRLTVEDKKITISVSPLLQRDVSYSLRIPRGALFDTLDNEFDGLPGGEYYFRTTDVIEVQEEDGNLAAEVVLFIVGVLFGLTCLLCMFALLCFAGFVTRMRMLELADDVEVIDKDYAEDQLFDFEEPQHQQNMDTIIGLGYKIDDPPMRPDFVEKMARPRQKPGGVLTVAPAKALV